jgi:hypothetical protein
MLNILIPYTVLLLFFCTMTNKCTIISQIITILHVKHLNCKLYYQQLHLK